MILFILRTLRKSVTILFFSLSISSAFWPGPALATNVDMDVRTVPLNATGDTIILKTKQMELGQRLFNQSCVQCHLDGGTKPNPEVDLRPMSLARAIPPRNNIEGIVNFLNEPRSYDSVESLSELHPSISRSDLFLHMKDLTNEDLKAIAGYILVQPKISGDQWGGGKPTR